MTDRPAAILRVVVLPIAIVAVWPAGLAAQSQTPGLRPGSFSLAAGLAASGGYDVGDRAAELRRNGSGPPVTLFRAESSFERAPGVELRIGYALTRDVVIEVGTTYATPRLAVRVSQDSETDEPITIGEEIAQYTIDVSALVQFSALAMSSRARPYAMAGAGYLRQLHEDRLLVEAGRLVHVGAGVRYWFRGGPSEGRALGLRVEGRFVRRTGGIEFDDRGRNHPAFSALGFIAF